MYNCYTPGSSAPRTCKNKNYRFKFYAETEARSANLQVTLVSRTEKKKKVEQNLSKTTSKLDSTSVEPSAETKEAQTGERRIA